MPQQPEQPDERLTAGGDAEPSQTNSPTGQGTPEPATSEPPASAFPKIIRFDALARCGDEIWIENEGQIYRLRKTKQGKLILTK